MNSETFRNHPSVQCNPSYRHIFSIEKLRLFSSVPTLDSDMSCEKTRATEILWETEHPVAQLRSQTWFLEGRLSS